MMRYLMLTLLLAGCEVSRTPQELCAHSCTPYHIPDTMPIMDIECFERCMKASTPKCVRSVEP